MTDHASAGGNCEVSEETVLALRRAVRGPLFLPGDAEYERARRVFNGMIDRHPGAVVQPLDAPDVSATVSLARANGILVSIKGGGHSAPGHGVCDGGLMVDLARLKRIEVDPVRRIARVGGGATWGELDTATQEHGLAVTGGRVPSTGVGGLTLGSGSGWLERAFGLTVDNLLSAEIVLANGDIVRASADDHAELFWALRGGGGNYGIVTQFEFRLHPVGPLLYAGFLIFSRNETARVMRRYRDFMESAPDEVGGALALVTTPPDPFLPPEFQGQPATVVIVVYTGKPEDGERAFGPILDLAPRVCLVQPMPYLDVQRLIDEANPAGLRNYWKADIYPRLPDAAVEALAGHSACPPSPFTSVLVQPLGGQVARASDESTPMGWRDAKWSVHIVGMWGLDAEDEVQIAWVRQLSSALGPWAREGGYLNYLMDEGEGRVRDAFGDHYARMVALKNRYDPTNFFRFNQNIRPDAAT